MKRIRLILLIASLSTVSSLGSQSHVTPLRSPQYQLPFYHGVSSFHNSNSYRRSHASNSYGNGYNQPQGQGHGYSGNGYSSNGYGQPHGQGHGQGNGHGQSSNSYSGNGYGQSHGHGQGHGDNGFYNRGYSYPIRYREVELICPEQTEDPYIATFSPDLTLLPSSVITAALALPALESLFACLTIMAIPATAPAIPPNPIFTNSTVTKCDYTVHPLASFNKYGGRCWLLPIFQERISYVRCMSKACKHEKCKSGYGSRNGYGYGYRTSKMVKRCLHTYRYESVWAYCEGRPLASRIVRERISVPDSCECRMIECKILYNK